MNTRSAATSPGLGGTVLVMLAHAFLTIAAAEQPNHPTTRR
ncbi:hypothetical protein [Streptomyces sp. NPDC058964]